MANEAQTPNFWDAMVMQPVLTQAERVMRDKFVDEYLMDFNALAAAIRIGFLRSVANEYATQLMDDPYVQQQIAKKQAELEANPKDAVRRRKRLTEMALYREAHYHGPGSSHAARVSALAKLASIYDMDAPTKIEQKVTHRGGIMVIPAIANLDDWEKAAQASQTKLVEDARV